MTEMTASRAPWSDPVVDEVRAAREKLFESCSFDLDELARRVQDLRRQMGLRDVTLAPRRLEADAPP